LKDHYDIKENQEKDIYFDEKIGLLH